MKAMEIQEWIFMLLTNVKSKSLNVKDKEKSTFVIVGNDEFDEFYGYTYSSRAQFASSMYTDSSPIFWIVTGWHRFLPFFIAQRKIKINSAAPDVIRNILGFDNMQCSNLCKKRDHDAIKNLDDVCEMTGISKNSKRFKALKDLSDSGYIVFSDSNEQMEM